MRHSASMSQRNGHNEDASTMCVPVITVTSSCARWRLRSPASRLFTQPFIQAQIKENIKPPRHWPLCGEFTGYRWIPRTKDQQHGKYFHLMTSSWWIKMSRVNCHLEYLTSKQEDEMRFQPELTFLGLCSSTANIWFLEQDESYWVSSIYLTRKHSIFDSKIYYALWLTVMKSKIGAEPTLSVLSHACGSPFREIMPYARKPRCCRMRQHTGHFDRLCFVGWNEKNNCKTIGKLYWVNSHFHPNWERQPGGTSE